MYKIYKIVDNTNGNVYVGQTKQKYLCERIKCHKYEYKNGRGCSCKNILCNNDWYYELIEETDDKSREEYWIKNTPNCINKTKYERLNNKQHYKKNLLIHEDFNKKRYERNKVNQKKTANDYYYYKKTWGGDPRNSNNLLMIDVNLFNTS